MTPPLFLLVGSTLCRFYDYWFHTCDNVALCADALVWSRFLACHVSCFFLNVVHILLKLIVALVQFLPFWSMFAFWPRFYWGILTNSNRRSLRDMFLDPRCQRSLLNGPPPVSCQTRRKFLARNLVWIQPMRHIVGCILHYKVGGAHATIGAAASPKVVEAINSATRWIYFDDPLWLLEPYSFFRRKADRPPDNAFTHFLAIAGIILLFASVIGYPLYLLQHQEGTHTALLPTANTHHVAITSSMDVCKEFSDTSHSFDSDGIPFVINNSATCIICNDRSQFVGPLQVQHISVKTTHGTASSAYAGTIAIRLTTNEGQTFEYHVPIAIYDPNLPFNILGIPFLGDYFGAKDTIPTRDDDRMYVRSSASKTTFVWDHSQHSQDFTHDARSLPVLTREARGWILSSILHKGAQEVQGYRSFCLLLCPFHHLRQTCNSSSFSNGNRPSHA